VAVWATQEETELPIGASFAGYRIEGVAGAGQMGVVYRATHPGLGRLVALKLIARELSDNYAFRRRFRADTQQAAAIGLVVHPGAALIYERSENAGRLFLVMRYVRGVDLGALIARDGALDPRRAVSIVRDVAAALDVAHRRGVVHRDLKPRHILLPEEPAARACLTDFGLTPLAFASAAHLAPERIDGEPADARCDVYALGRVLLDALGDDPPRGLAAIIARATSTSPADRYATAGELATAAGAALASESSRPPAGPGKRAGRAGRRASARPAEQAPPAAGRSPAGSNWASATAARRSPAGPRERDPRAPRRPPLRGIALAAALVGLLLAALLTATGGVGGSEEAPSPPVSATRASGEIPAAPARARPPAVVDTIAVGKAADGIAFADGAVWAAAPRDGALVRMDARTGRVIGRARAGLDPDSVAAGGGIAWVSSRGDGRLRRFATDLEPIGARAVGAKPEGIALDREFAWVVSAADDTVTRVDRASGAAVGKPIRVGGQPIDIAIGPTGVWTANSADGSVTRVDRDTGRVAGTISVGREPKGVIEGLGSVWVANGGDDTVSRIDPRTGRVTATIDVGDQPSKLAVASGLVWVTNFGDGTVRRIDPASGRLAGPAVAVGRRPVGIVAGAGHVWVASLAEGTVTKLRP
jgi:YVTN family beta-propeller protein